MNCASYHTLSCCLQPSLGETSTLQLEPSFTSQMFRPFKASQVTKLRYQSLMMTSLNRASPLSVLFKEVLWILSGVLHQIESQLKFVMMMVSTCMVMIYICVRIYM